MKMLIVSSGWMIAFIQLDIAFIRLDDSIHPAGR
jgi:hypothetical protein